MGKCALGARAKAADQAVQIVAFIGALTGRRPRSLDRMVDGLVADGTRGRVLRSQGSHRADGGEKSRGEGIASATSKRLAWPRSFDNQPCRCSLRLMDDVR